MSRIIALSDVDTNGLVSITLNNSHYKDSIPMELGFKWPKNKIQIIQIIKAAARLNLDISFYSKNKDAETFMSNYYEEYNS